MVEHLLPSSEDSHDHPGRHQREPSVFLMSGCAPEITAGGCTMRRCVRKSLILTAIMALRAAGRISKKPIVLESVPNHVALLRRLLG